MNPDSVCVTLLSPGAAWQCAVVRRGLRLECTAQLWSRYTNGFDRVAVSFLSPRARLTDGAGWPQLREERCRLVTGREHQALYLSGSAEDRGTMLWDLRLIPFTKEEGGPLYRTEGRIICNGQETLFPFAASFLLLQRGLPALCCAGFSAASRARLSLTDTAGGAFTAESCRIVLSPGTVRQGQDGGDVYSFQDTETRLYFCPIIQPEFRFRLPHGAAAVTRFGSWRSEAPALLTGLPGFIISVI